MKYYLYYTAQLIKARRIHSFIHSTRTKIALPSSPALPCPATPHVREVSPHTMASLLGHVCTPVLTTYTKPTSCSRCHSYLLGLWHQGYHCYQCSSTFHARCTNASSSKQPPNAAERQQYDTCTNCSCKPAVSSRS